MPIRSEVSKQQIIDALLRVKRRAHKLVIRLLFAEEEQEARKVEWAARRLSRRIDGLLGAAMEEWTGTAASVKDQIGRCHDALGRRIASIQRGVKIAENVGEAVEAIDDAAAIAARLMI